MWSLYLSIGCFLIFIGLVIATLPSQRTRQIAVSYRFRYLKLIDALEDLTSTANQLYSLAEKHPKSPVNDDMLRSFRMLETLMETARKIPPFGFETAPLAAACFLATDIADKFSAIERKLKGVLFEKLVPKFFRKTTATPAAYAGCYFCSRPFDPSLFSQVRVRTENQARDVMSCHWCKQVLTKTKKARVLYFLKDGKPVHWSAWEEFVPAPHFWNINTDDGPAKPTGAQKLQLVYSDRDH